MQTKTRHAPPAYLQDTAHRDTIDWSHGRFIAPKHDSAAYIVTERPMSEHQLQRLRAIEGSLRGSGVGS